MNNSQCLKNILSFFTFPVFLFEYQNINVTTFIFILQFETQSYPELDPYQQKMEN